MTNCSRRFRGPFVQRIQQLELLETRMLLAGDLVASWQNPVDCNDTNQDGIVSAVDALNVIQQINRGGARQLPELASGEPGSLSSVALIDTNGDGFLTPADAHQVIEFLNAQGEGEVLSVRLEVTDLDGNVITNADVGDEFQVRTYIQDLRDGDEAQGVFAAYLDVTYDDQLASVTAAPAFGTTYANGRSGDISTDGLIDEVGAFAGGTPLLSDEYLLFTVNMRADAEGTLTFGSNAADVLPVRETLFFGTLDPVTEADIDFGSAQLQIGSVVPDTPDLVQFAKDLEAAGTQFWSTNQRSADAVSQRELFEDGAKFLPVEQYLNSNGTVNPAAATAGVTEINTWVFPDGSQATGVLTLEEIASRSGVAIPAATSPSLVVVGSESLEVEIESPRQLPLDGYDPVGGGLTYSVSVADSDLVEATVVNNNRYWSLEIADYGTMVFEFFEDKATRATDQFIELTEAGFYDGIILHRVIDGFVIQGGDPTGTGTSGSTLPDFDDQFHVDLQHNQLGVLSMAKRNDDTNNSQFFVTDGITQHLDFNHTIFGQLIEGFDVLEGITLAMTGAGDRPVEDIVISRATVFQDTENAVLTVRALDSSGTTSVTVTATDADGNSSSEVFDVSLAPSSRNSQPFLDDIPDFSATRGSTLEFQLGYTDIEDNSVFFFAEMANGSEGTVDVSDSGLVTVTIPSDAEVGSVLGVNVTVSESFSGSNRDEQLVNITVTNETAGVDDSFTVDEDTSDNTLDVLANDELADGFQIVDVVDAANGTFEISSDGLTLLYSPNADFFGVSTATYFVSNGAGESVVANVTVNVNNVLDAPTARDDFFPEDLEQDDPDRALFVEDATEIRLSRVLFNDLNADGNFQEIVTYTDVTDPQNGTVTWNALEILYTPDPDFFGTDSFEYTITGADSGLTSTATITVNIEGVNDFPIAVGETVTVTAGQTNIISADELLANDLPGPDNESDQTLRLFQLNYSGAGSVFINADGDLEYTPADGFRGSETIVYSVQDDGRRNGADDFKAAITSLTVNVEGGPLAADDSFEVDFEAGPTLLDVLANDDQTLSLEIISVSTSSNSTLSIVDGQVEYTPNTGFAGEDSFTYTVRDADGMEATATATVTVAAQGPTAVDDAFTVEGAGSLDVLANDVLGIGATQLIISGLTQPTNGFVSVVDSQVEFLADDGFVGEDTFTYTVSDENGKTSTATVTLTVEEPANNPPTASDDSFVIDADSGEQIFDVLENDSTLPDVDETKSIEAIIVDPANGTAVISADGLTILYTPSAGFAGTDTLEYRMTDGNGASDTATVTVTVTEVNVEPVAVDDFYAIGTPGSQTLDVLDNDSGQPGEVLTITSIDTSGTAGSVTISADGTRIIYTPDFDSLGADTFTYTIDDGTGLTSEATVEVNVMDDGVSFYSGYVYTDIDNDGVRDPGERGVGGVTMTLTGTAEDGSAVSRETVTTLSGEFTFSGIGPGDYTIAQVQPAFMNSGQNRIGSQSADLADEFDLQVTQQLIASSGNSYGERGLIGRFALLEALSSFRGDGLFVVMEGDELSWVEDRGGWSDVETIGITMNGDELTVVAEGVGNEVLSMSNRAEVDLIGRQGVYTIMRINGSSSEVLGAAAVDAVFAG